MLSWTVWLLVDMPDPNWEKQNLTSTAKKQNKKNNGKHLEVISILQLQGANYSQNCAHLLCSSMLTMDELETGDNLCLILTVNKKKNCIPDYSEITRRMWDFGRQPPRWLLEFLVRLRD